MNTETVLAEKSGERKTLPPDARLWLLHQVVRRWLGRQYDTAPPQETADDR